MDEKNRLDAFAAEHGISMTADLRDSNPHVPESGTMDHWRVTLRHAGRTYTLTFSRGLGFNGAPPSVGEVLGCFAADSVYSDTTFEEWCADLGFDSDSRKAERTYKAVVDQTERARRLLGEHVWAALMCEAAS